MFHVYLCCAVMSVSCSLVFTCWEGLTSWLSCVVFSCDFVTFYYSVPGQIRYLIVLIPDLSPPLYLILHTITSLYDIYEIPQSENERNSP